MAWFDIFASEYDSWYSSDLGSFVDEIEKELVEKVAIFNSNEKVLDIGAGTGNYSIWMAKKGLDVTSIDQSKGMLEVARKKSEKENLNINFIYGDAHSLDFEDCTFDIVISVTAIEFMENASIVLKEAYRVLKPKGRLVVGLLTKNSSWGEMYRQSIKENPDSIFSKAHLYEEDELMHLLPYSYKLLKGLYIPPSREFDKEVTLAMEKRGQVEQADNAGFYVVRWDKE
ncbi:MAG: class I SAM-dependent methyltransferase [Vulcanibacillus sp.]